MTAKLIALNKEVNKKNRILDEISLVLFVLGSL